MGDEPRQISPAVQQLRDLAAEKDDLTASDLFLPLVEALPDALVVARRDGTIVLVNGQAELLFGYHRSELIGQPVEICIPAALHEAHRQHRETYVQEPHLRPMGAGQVLHGRDKAGAEIPLEISLGPIMVRSGLLVLVILRRRRE